MNAFIPAIYKWYNINKRNLPWRHTSDPYKIWVSEIILQQTRVEQGIPYYNAFIRKFPQLADLAKASEDDVLKQWQGLGYYSRARNMYETAQVIYHNFDGIFPNKYELIRSLKGVGIYTAAAIASIAFNLPYPAVDGNVYRLLARYFGIFEDADSSKGRKMFLKIATELMPDKNPGYHNQALIEFGAVQCKPKSPGCAVCPLAATCFAFKNNQVENLPAKKAKVKIRLRYFYFYLMESDGFIWIEKRTGNDIWKNLYQFPLHETERELSDEEMLNAEPPFLKGYKMNVKSVSLTQKHNLTHQTIFARLVHVELDSVNDSGSPLFKIPKNRLSFFAIPRLLEKLLEKCSSFQNWR